MVYKIALEEHFMMPLMREYFDATLGDVPPAKRDTIIHSLNDFGEQRLAQMDEAGIGMSLLSLAGPGVQEEPDAGVATARATAANDYLAGKIQDKHERYRGLAHLGLQNPAAAARELERCIGDLGFVGCMINGHTRGRYLDDPFFLPFWEAAAGLNVPVYLHPADPASPLAAVDGHAVLKRATWGWTVETASHALRMIFSGLFDRFPDIKLVLGHLGETLPYQLWRFDSRAKLYDCKLAREPSEYIRKNITVTLSGTYSREPLECALAALGTDRVCFAADYPFENSPMAGRFLDTVELEETTRDAVAHGNAKRLFGL